MLDWLRRRRDLERSARGLYDAIVAQARSAPFYGDLAVPDTMEGRFEMIVLHLVLVLERLKDAGPDGQRLGQTLIETLVAEVDDALRQIGIGDMGVPRRVKRAAAAVGERSGDYLSALSAPPETAADLLVDALLRHVYAQDDPSAAPAEMRGQAGGLARAVHRTREALAKANADDLLGGRVSMPDANEAAPAASRDWRAT